LNDQKANALLLNEKIRSTSRNSSRAVNIDIGGAAVNIDIGGAAVNIDIGGAGG
jgi:hypothetical protein